MSASPVLTGVGGGPPIGREELPYQVLTREGVTSAFTGPTRHEASSSASTNSSTLVALSIVFHSVRPRESRSSSATLKSHHTHGRPLSGATVAIAVAGRAIPAIFT